MQATEIRDGDWAVVGTTVREIVRTPATIGGVPVWSLATKDVSLYPVHSVRFVRPTSGTVEQLTARRDRLVKVARRMVDEHDPAAFLIGGRFDGMLAAAIRLSAAAEIADGANPYVRRAAATGRKTCHYCDATIDTEQIVNVVNCVVTTDTIWVDVVSGDDGGTYDHCDRGPGNLHVPCSADLCGAE